MYGLALGKTYKDYSHTGPDDNVNQGHSHDYANH
jgi:hypothetical protein